MSIGILRDPLQGFDIRVKAVSIGTAEGGNGSTQRLIGQFNSFMWRIINQTEAYLAMGGRIPRMLDGEVLTVWSLDQGLIDLNIVARVFGPNFANALVDGRQGVIPRQERVNLVAEAGTATSIHSKTPFGEAGFNLGDGTAASEPNLTITLKFCRTDTLTFGVAPGRAVAANSIQGTAEGATDGTV